MPVENTVLGRKTNPEKVEAAKVLRRASTRAENLLWASLRKNHLDGWHFRRQQVIAGFVVDFYCHAAALIIEVDGEIHQEQAEYDQERTNELQASGYRVLRFTNREVFETLEAVLCVIRENLAA